MLYDSNTSAKVTVVWFMFGFRESHCLVGCPTLISVAVIKHLDQKKYLDEQIFIWFMIPGHSLSLRVVMAETCAETMEKHFLLACLHMLS